jgi:hypothetical protein
MSVGNENKAESNRDPRTRLVREKYFSIRPRPLERWLWRQAIPASAERVFWLHWQEGTQRGDWCSEIPLRRVAQECNLDVSTVTRAYQLLTKMGCIRRTDPGRDPANPFQQATALTEVRLPRELLAELDRHPNRRTPHQKTERPEHNKGSEATGSEGEGPQANATAPVAPTMDSQQTPDPLAGLSGRDRVRALTQLTDPLSATERTAYQEAIRLHRPSMTFDMDSKLPEEARAVVLQVLSSLATPPVPKDTQVSNTNPRIEPRPRNLSVFELARLKREIQTATSTSTTPDLLRQVIWSIEAGALRRFSPPHAIHIALKKIREGAWTRPHRMPPQWVHALSAPAATETCRVA